MIIPEESFVGAPQYMTENEFSFRNLPEIIEAIEVYKTADNTIDLEDQSHPLSENLRSFWKNVWKFKYLPESFLREYDDFANYDIIVSNQKLSEDYIFEVIADRSFVDFKNLFTNQQVGEENILEIFKKIEDYNRKSFWKYVSKTQNISVEFIREHAIEIDFNLLQENENLGFESSYVFGVERNLVKADLSAKQYLEFITQELRSSKENSCQL